MRTALYHYVRDYFLGLSARDQRAVILLALFFALITAWFGIWQPLQNAKERNRLSYQAATQDYQWMQEHAAFISHTAAPTPISENTPLLTTASNSALQHAITIAHAEEVGGNNSFRFTIENTPFEKIILWLDSLQRESGIRCNAIAVESDPTSGTVKAEITLEAKH